MSGRPASSSHIIVSGQLCAWRPKRQAQGPSGHAYSNSTPNQVVSRHQVAAVQGDSAFSQQHCRLGKTADNETPGSSQKEVRPGWAV
jgi:hypothetical protein